MAQTKKNLPVEQPTVRPKKLNLRQKMFARLYTNPSNPKYFGLAQECWKASYRKAFLRLSAREDLSPHERNHRMQLHAAQAMKKTTLINEIERLIKKNMPQEYSFEGVEKMLEEHLTSENSAERFKAKELLLTHLSKITDLQLKHGYLQQEDLTGSYSTAELLEKHKLLTEELLQALPAGDTNSNELDELSLALPTPDVSINNLLEEGADEVIDIQQ